MSEERVLRGVEKAGLALVFLAIPRKMFEGFRNAVEQINAKGQRFDRRKDAD